MQVNGLLSCQVGVGRVRVPNRLSDVLHGTLSLRPIS
jgi:hypothetical protein